MKIARTLKSVVSELRIEYKKDFYSRIVYSDGSLRWDAISFDGKVDEEKLESEYLKLINKKITEKDYEILCYSRKENRHEHSLTKRDCFWDIHSVKRLSDGEIFTIGDKIDGLSYKNIVIDDIWLNPNCETQILFNHKDEGICFNKASKFKEPLFRTDDGVDAFEEQYGYACIICANGEHKYFYLKYNNGYIDSETPVNKWFSKKENAEKWCKVLFTTEDGVDIFTDDYCYFVRSTLKQIEEPFLITKEFWLGNLKLYKWFSTKEKAEEYILMNKPCLSISDIMMKNEISHNEIFDKVLIGVTFSKLEELVKEKLKQN